MADDPSKADLKKEIQVILKGADLDHMSAKQVRQELQEKLDCDLAERKKEVDQLVMEVIDEQEDEDEEEDDDEEENYAEEEDDDEAEKSEDDESEEEGPPSDGGGSDYEPNDKPAAKKAATKRAAEWGGTDKKKKKPALFMKATPTPTPKRKKKGSDDDSDDDFKPKKKKKKKAGGGGAKAIGWTFPIKLSEQLTEVVGGDEMPRYEVLTRMWAYIKEKNLQDPNNKQLIVCDEKLSNLFPLKKFRGFGMTKFLKEHMNVDKV